METYTNWRSAIEDAWNTLRPTIAEQLPKLAVGSSLSDQTYSDKLGVCAALNSTTGGGGAAWGDDGKGTIELENLRITAFEQVVSQPLAFDGLTIGLPLNFAVLQAKGRYHYTQPCALYSLGKKGTKTQVRGEGAVTTEAATGTLTYRTTVLNPDTNPELEPIKLVTVDGKRAVNVVPDGSPDNTVLRWLVDVFGRGLQEKSLIQTPLQEFFADNSFARNMIDQLNQIIQAGTDRAPSGLR